MTPDLDLGPDAQANNALAVLRGMSFERDLIGPRCSASDGQLVPGIFIASDPEGKVRIRGKTQPGTVVELNIDVARPGRWLALHVALGPADLTEKQVAGLICKVSSPYATTLEPCLRSGLPDGGFVDSFFRKRVLAHSEASLYLDVLLPGPANNLPRTATWREIVLFLRPETSRIVLHDMRLFIV